MNKYNPQEIEKKWQDFWKKNPDLFEADDNSEKPKKFILDMFPYPSGAGIHIGHVESYTATDIISRYYKMKGYNVMHPQGWDAFGLPAENYAIKSQIHPMETTNKAIENFKKQINSLGYSYDWHREINTSAPDYYKWTQWFFLLLYKNGLAYKKKANVNWCKSCQTVLANEQVENGKCERCKNEVSQKDLEQWFFKITDFIEDNKNTKGLISGLDNVDWPDSTKAAQKNWIGKSEGVEFEMKILESDENISFYTTRIDTVFGVTYAVVSPEHEIIEKIKNKIENWNEVENYIIQSKGKTELERTEQKEKTGIEIKGLKVINPFNSELVTLFVGDYVLGHYGTGAVMAVPAHDERDYEFAKKHALEIREVIRSDKEISSVKEQAFIQDGSLCESEEYSGLSSEDARNKMTAWLEEKGIGKRKVNYRLRDWLVSRQRYWGAPIPIIYCEKCGQVAVPEDQLPVKLPTDVDFNPTGESPLVNSKTFHDVKCPECGEKAKRESDTMDTFVCSSWYYFRYADPKNEKEFASKKQIKKWMPVDIYVGGAEHTVLHLLYARFFTKVLHKLGHIDFDEPFLKLRHQGIILAEDGKKMSKSLGNVVNPDDIVSKVGADTLRMFEMFMGPLEDMKPWNTKGISGIARFLERFWKLQEKAGDQNEISKSAQTLLHKTIKKVTEDIENFRFNTAISAMMILVNALEKEYAKSATTKAHIRKEDYEKLILILAPFAPHIAEELWFITQTNADLGRTDAEKSQHKSVFLEKWPMYDEELMKEDEVEIIIQVNGKLRDKLLLAHDITEDKARETAFESEKVKIYTSGKEIKKIIFVPRRLINIVTA